MAINTKASHLKGSKSRTIRIDCIALTVKQKKAPVKRKKIYMTMIHCDQLSICQDEKGFYSVDYYDPTHRYRKPTCYYYYLF